MVSLRWGSGGDDVIKLGGTCPWGAWDGNDIIRLRGGNTPLG